MNNVNLVKKCRVCGDDALCFNFNGLSCEACKVFFRRNSFKKFKCRNTRTCTIDRSTRKFCKRCRMDKCLAIGMKKEFVQNYHGKIRTPFNNKIPSVISDLNQLLPYDLNSVNELHSAMSVFPPEQNMTLRGYTHDLVEIVDTNPYYIQRAVKFCKQIGWFKAFNSTDQYALLRSFYSEFEVIYGAFDFDVDTNSMIGVVDESKKEIIKYIIKSTTNEARLFGKLMIQMKYALENDNVIRNLVISLVLFKPRDNTSRPEFINYIYAAIFRLLWKYLKYKYRAKAEHKFTTLMEAMGELGSTCRLMHNAYSTIESSQVPELMAEMYGPLFPRKN